VPEIEGIERVLVVVAHPDDVDFGSAGTIAKWTQAGVAISYCIITDGDAGGFDENITRTEMAQIRREEQRAAAQKVGVDDITFLGYPDGRLTATFDLRRDITRVIRQKKPQRVLCQSPERNYQRIFASHPDHLVAGESALCAVYPDARNPFTHQELLRDEGLEPHVVDEVWLMAMQDADVYVDISDTFDTKISALRCHVSQISHVDDLEDRLRQWATAVGEQAGFPKGKLGESFQRVPTA
jgi:LmbE family N-acetylglucosaminyl deacetylase